MDSITKNALINDFINRSFRDIADRDYVCARLCHRYGLYTQFYWAALQAIEKYLKAILLYNRRSAKKIGHNITKAYDRILDINDIKFKFPNMRKYLKHIEEQGQNRYFEYPSYVYGRELLYLDKTVWHIRQYCFYIRQVVPDGGKLIDKFPCNISKIEENIKRGPSRKSFAFWGTLENILSDKKSKLRRHLVWKNLYFGSYRKKAIRYSSDFQFSNPTHIINPQIYVELDKIVDFSKSVRDYFKKNY